MNSIEGLAPEQIQQLVRLGGLGEKNDLLKEQMARAEALKNPRQAYGFWGGLTNGLADATDKVFSGFKAHDAQEMMKANMAEIDRLRGLAGGALGARPQPMPQEWESSNMAKGRGSF